MSDKVTKIRINGVEKEVAGSGGSGGISGAYLAPKTLISPDYTGFEQATINPTALVEQLEKAGFPVDTPVMPSGESVVFLVIGTVYPGEKLPYSILQLTISLGSKGLKSGVDIMGQSFGEEQLPSQTTLREIINYIFATPQNHVFTLNSIVGYLDNFVGVLYREAGEQLHYYISNMTEFCEEVIIEYHSTSDGGDLVLNDDPINGGIM